MLAHECSQNKVLQKQVAEQQEATASLKLAAAGMARCVDVLIADLFNNKLEHSDKTHATDRITELENALKIVNECVQGLRDDQVWQ
jgi:hypothetical protein